MHSRVFYSCIALQHFNPTHSFVQCAVIGHSSGRHCADDGKLLRGILSGGLRWANCSHIRKPRLGDGIGKEAKKERRKDFTISVDYLEVEGGQEEHEVESVIQRKIQMAQASRYFGSGQIQFVVVVGSVANTGNDRTHPQRCVVFPSLPDPYFLSVLHTSFSFLSRWSTFNTKTCTCTSTWIH